MASGAPVVQVLRVMPPGANFAYLSRIAGTSTPAECVTVWTFPTGTGNTQTYLDHLCVLRGYAGGGLTLSFKSGASVNSNNYAIEAAVRRVADDAEDLDTTGHTYDYNTSGAITAPSAIGEVSYDTVTFTDGADMDSWADGELAIVRVKVDSNNANHSLANSSFTYIYGFDGRET